MTATGDTADDGWRVLHQLGWDGTWSAAMAEVLGSDETDGDGTEGRRPRPGRLVRTHRVGFDVLTPDGREFTIHQGSSRDPLTAPATGDWVVVVDEPDVEHPVITAVLPRRTQLVRRDPADRAAPQVLAAGADVVAVVQGADRPVNPRRLERQLAVAHGSDADVVVILTKVDLPSADDALAAIGAAAPGTPVIRTAAHDGTGIDQVDRLTAGSRTLVLLGESGAGKSSLVNAVIGHEAVAIGAVREGDRKGRHTTTRRELIPLPRGGALLDTPGVRAVGLWPDATDLEAVFTEVAQAAQECRFADCSHDAEPGCAVRAAAESGAIAADRLQAWRALSAEVEGTRDEVRQAGWR